MPLLGKAEAKSECKADYAAGALVTYHMTMQLLAPGSQFAT